MNIINTSARLCAYLMLFFTVPLYGNIIHVSKSGSPNGTGQSWADAMDEFVQAIAVAQDGDTIFIAAGTYLLPFKDRLWITQNLHIYGGFKGWETSVNERIPDVNTTVIAGNSVYSKIVLNDVKRYILFDGVNFIDGHAFCPECGDVVPDSLDYVKYGGSILFYRTIQTDTLDLTFNNCEFSKNTAYAGGAMYLSASALVGSIKIKNCRFKENSSWQDGYVGALAINVTGLNRFVIELDSCTFYKNTSLLGYAAMLIDILSINSQDSVIISNCLFKENAGGGYTNGTIGIERKFESFHHPNILVDQCQFVSNRYFTENYSYKLGGSAISTNFIFQAQILNSLFAGNQTNGYGLLSGLSFDVSNSLFVNNYARDGGAIYFDRSTFVWPSRELTRFTNCTFANNHSQGPGALFLKDGPISHFKLSNCVLYNNSSAFHPSMFYSRMADTSNVIPPKISYIGGDVDPSFFHFNEETDNWILDTDSSSWYIGNPLFVDTLSNDFRLKRCSPFINRGLNAFVSGNEDLEGTARILEDTVDLGAFERLRFIPEMDILPATCAHNPDGEILLIPEGYTPPAIWNIIDETGTAHENGKLAPGTYESIMQDGEDCSVVFQVVVPGPDTITAQFEVQGAQVASPVGSIVVDTIFGGVPGYEVKWFDGSNDLSKSGLTPGLYSVTITDEVACDRVWEIEVPLINHVSVSNQIGHFTIVNPSGLFLEYQWDPEVRNIHTWSLVNVLGQEVSSGQLIPGRQQVNLSWLASGQYWLRIFSTDLMATYPIFIVNW